MKSKRLTKSLCEIWKQLGKGCVPVYDFPIALVLSQMSSVQSDLNLLANSILAFNQFYLTLGLLEKKNMGEKMEKN